MVSVPRSWGWYESMRRSVDCRHSHDAQTCCALQKRRRIEVEAGGGVRASAWRALVTDHCKVPKRDDHWAPATVQIVWHQCSVSHAESEGFGHIDRIIMQWSYAAGSKALPINNLARSLRSIPSANSLPLSPILPQVFLRIPTIFSSSISGLLSKPSN